MYTNDSAFTEHILFIQIKKAQDPPKTTATTPHNNWEIIRQGDTSLLYYNMAMLLLSLSHTHTHAGMHAHNSST